MKNENSCCVRVTFDDHSRGEQDIDNALDAFDIGGYSVTAVADPSVIVRTIKQVLKTEMGKEAGAILKELRYSLANHPELSKLL
jgi:hypothetical protein